MEWVASKQRNQPAPPRILFDDLIDPHRNPTRPWLLLRRGEMLPRVVYSSRPSLVVWSSLWPERPEAQIAFDLPPSDGGGTDLRWTLSVVSPAPDDLLLRRMTHRIGVLINSNLRHIYGN